MCLCSINFAVAEENSDSSRRDQQLAAVYNSLRWDKSAISVCWLNINEAPSKERRWVSQTLKSTWEKYSGIRFVGWRACNGRASDISILIEDTERAPRSHLGINSYRSSTRKSNPSMHLNFTFKNWSTSCGETLAERKRCIEATTVHEFGHALGFTHEQDRNDTPEWCKKEEEHIDTDDSIDRLGAWDKFSVMNYCNPKWNNGGELSATDKRAVSSLYPIPDNLVYPGFNSQYYLERNPRLIEQFGTDYDSAYEYWMDTGLDLGQRASREFDVKFYTSYYDDVSYFKDAYWHWRNHGRFQRRLGSIEPIIVTTIINNLLLN